MWVIRDGQRKKSTGCGEDDEFFAEIALQEYVRSREAERQEHFVYFITCDYPDYPIKIGVTSRHSTRFTDLQTAMPYRIVPLVVLRVSDREIERSVQRRFVNQRLRGEWFSRSDELMSVIKDLQTSAANMLATTLALTHSPTLSRANAEIG